VKGPRTPSRDQEFETERERPTKRERSAKHKKRQLPEEPGRPPRAAKPKVRERSVWEEDDYLDDNDGPNIWDCDDDADPVDAGAAHDH